MTSLFSASWKNPGLTFYGLSRAAQPTLAWQQALSSPLLVNRRGLRRTESYDRAWLEAAAAAGGCPTSAAFLARTSGLDATHIAAYNALICGLVSDGVWTKLDVLHIYATQDITTALLNLVSTNYTGSIASSLAQVVFTADRGINMVGGQIGGGHVDTQFNPITATSPNYTQDLAHISAWTLTAANDVGFGPIGANDASILTHLRPLQGGVTYFWLNTPIANNIPVASGGSVGFFAASRNSSSQVIGYKNGASIVTANSNTSGTPANKSIYTVARNDNGTPEVYTGQVAMASIGGALSGTDVANLYNRLRTYMTAVGVP